MQTYSGSSLFLVSRGYRASYRYYQNAGALVRAGIKYDWILFRLEFTLVSDTPYWIDRGGDFSYSTDPSYDLVDFKGTRIDARPFIDRIRQGRRDKAEQTFRNGSIPGTGSHRRHRGSLLRNPHTFQEAKWTGHGLDEFADYGIRVKGRRRKDLPKSWDDIPRHRSRSWKKHRRTQWVCGGALS